MRKTSSGSWIQPRDVGAVRRTTWATALIVVLTILMLLTATFLPAQSSASMSHSANNIVSVSSAGCGRQLAQPLAVSAVASVAVVGVELQGMSRGNAWHTMDQSNASAIVADPSSHLHALGSYHLTRVATAAFARCQSSGRAVLSGAMWALAIGTGKEVVDGWYTGFSTIDLAVDVVGAGYAVAQSKVPMLLHVTPTISIAPQALRSVTSTRGALTDYANQTVWLSANVHDMLPSAAARAWPSAVRLSVGRRSEGGAHASQYVVGVDLDAARLPGSNPTWMRVKSALHNVRLPGPALVVGSSGATAFGLYW